MFGIHCVLIFLEHALSSLSLRSEASKDTGGLSFLLREQTQRSPETQGLVRSPSPFPIRLC